MKNSSRPSTFPLRSKASRAADKSNDATTVASLIENIFEQNSHPLVVERLWTFMQVIFILDKTLNILVYT